jgi:hypothetical protein
MEKRYQLPLFRSDGVTGGIEPGFDTLTPDVNA